MKDFKIAKNDFKVNHSKFHETKQVFLANHTLNPLSANHTKRSITLKQFVGKGRRIV